MNWKAYEKLLDEKIKDAKFTLEYTSKKHMEAKAKYESVLLEKESFLKALDEKLGD